jgi:hypothetical protein
MDGEHIVGSSFLFEADPHISMATSTSASINSAQSEPLGTVRTNWTHGVSCSSLDQVYHIQVVYYWNTMTNKFIK